MGVKEFGKFMRCPQKKLRPRPVFHYVYKGEENHIEAGRVLDLRHAAPVDGFAQP